MTTTTKTFDATADDLVFESSIILSDAEVNSVVSELMNQFKKKTGKTLPNI